MSTPTHRRGGTGTAAKADPGVAAPLRSVDPFRLLAMASILTLTGSYVWKLYEIGQVVGGSTRLLVVVALSLGTATVLARLVDARTAAVVAVTLAVVGYGYYLVEIPGGFSLVADHANQILADVVTLMTGLSVLRITRADLWMLGFAPGPVFLSWFLATRRRYLAGACVGGLALLTLVSTGDASIPVALVGTLGGIAAVGFGELERRDGTLLQADSLVILVALITLVAASPMVVPGEASPLDWGTSGGGTVEGTFVGTPGEMDIAGAINLSPTVRFTVDADRERYWRTGVYDRFTGSGWTRTGQSRAYRDGLLDSPPGPREAVVQTYTVENRVRTMPAAAEPVAVIGEATRNTRVTGHGTLKPASGFIEGDQYRVRSMALNATPAELRRAGTDYPEAIRALYLQTPDSTSREFRALTARIAGGADNPYDAAKRIETYLERNKGYSLNVEEPSGNIANKFLLEMDQGYCTYFATTMALMLRSEGIPARIATGYTPGQRIDDGEYLVRGLNSHVWVEAYFPEYGWVTFDPTPASPRQLVENDRLREARDSGNEGQVDTDESEDVPITTTPTTDSFNRTTNETVPGPGPGTITIPRDRNLPNNPDPLPNGTVGGDGNDGAGGLPPMPSGRDAVVGLAVLFGAVAGAHRAGLGERAYRAARLRWQGARTTPRADVERAHERLETLLAREFRPRDPGETHREYVDRLADRGLDDRAKRVFEIHERARYAGSVDTEAADEAVGLVNAMVKERTPLVGRIRRALR